MTADARPSHRPIGSGEKLYEPNGVVPESAADRTRELLKIGGAEHGLLRSDHRPELGSRMRAKTKGRTTAEVAVVAGTMKCGSPLQCRLQSKTS